MLKYCIYIKTNEEERKGTRKNAAQLKFVKPLFVVYHIIRSVGFQSNNDSVALNTWYNLKGIRHCDMLKESLLNLPCTC